MVSVGRIKTMELMMKVLLLTLAVLVAACYVYAASERPSYVIVHYLLREMKLVILLVQLYELGSI